jgi:hypothetical protein
MLNDSIDFRLRRIVFALTVGLTAAGCSSSDGGGGSLDHAGTGGNEPVSVACESGTTNMAVSGVTAQPLMIAGGSFQTVMQYQNGGFTGVSLIMTQNGTELTMTLISNSGTAFAQGDKLAVGVDPGLHISGHSMTENYLCYSMSGEADVETLSADTSVSPAMLSAAHIGFDIMCDTKSALPPGTTHVSGCLNYRVRPANRVLTRS